MSLESIIASIPKQTPIEREAMRSNAEKALATGDPKKIADAELLLQALTVHEADIAKALRMEIMSLPRIERIVKAFRFIPMTKTEAMIVQVLLDNPGLTSDALSGKSGWAGNAWHMHFGTMCRHREHLISLAPPAEKRGAEFYTGILAEFDDATRGFTMLPDAVAAFKELGFRAKEAP